MKVLLDTHTFIWFINGNKLLPEKVMLLISNPENQCFLSIASIWELAIKTSIGKLKLQSNFERIREFLAANSIVLLPTEFAHLQTLLKLEYYHRDPFDRVIISQGISENLTVISKDSNFTNYPVKLSWG